MWTDAESDIDFVHFSSVAESIVDCVVDTGDRPVCIGISGAWGTGKSTMLCLTEKLLKQHGEEYIFVKFNAWVYQGFDDARAAIMEAIATELQKTVSTDKTLLDKAKDIGKRINWIRVAGIATTAAATMALGIPPIGAIGEAISAGKKLIGGDGEKEDAEKLLSSASEVRESITKELESPPKEIDKIRREFEELLDSTGKRLVVFIDDLDRCLPKTAIETLEAIRLFLFMRKSSFLIAADTLMIKDSVRKHFDGLNEAYVTNYFDKLIQIPISVPQLGPTEAKAYMMNLFASSVGVAPATRDEIRIKTKSGLDQAWRGSPFSAVQILESIAGEHGALLEQFRLADSLGLIMSNNTATGGNPRLIKRFLNTISLRKKIASRHGVTLNESIAIKMYLIERYADAFYDELVIDVVSSKDGNSQLLNLLENSGQEAKDLEGNKWGTPFIGEWKKIEPPLSSVDLRPYIFISKARAVPVLSSAPLSRNAAALLESLLSDPETASKILKSATLPKDETSQMLDAILAKFNDTKYWGSNGETTALCAFANLDEGHSKRVVAFLLSRPASAIRPAIVPKIQSFLWSTQLFDQWMSDNEIESPIKKAIKELRKTK